MRNRERNPSSFTFDRNDFCRVQSENVWSENTQGSSENLANISPSHNHSLIGNVYSEQKCGTTSILCSGDQFEIDFYVRRYYQVVQYYVNLNKEKMLKRKADIALFKRLNPNNFSCHRSCDVMKENKALRKLSHSEHVSSSVGKFRNLNSSTQKSRLLQNTRVLSLQDPLVQKVHFDKACKDNVDDYKLQCEWLSRSFQTYLPNMRTLYNHYSYLGIAVRADWKEPLLNRLAFWQFLRDYGMHKIFDSLEALEKVISFNPYVRLIKDIGLLKFPSIQNEADPYEPLGFPQFVHSLVELCWVLYGGQRATQRTPWPTHMSGCLYRLMSENLAKQKIAGKVVRNVHYSRLVPVVFSNFQKLANPLSLRQLLRLLHELHGSRERMPTVELSRMILDSEKYETFFGSASDFLWTKVKEPETSKGVFQSTRTSCSVNTLSNDISSISSCIRTSSDRDYSSHLPCREYNVQCNSAVKCSGTERPVTIISSLKEGTEVNLKKLDESLDSQKPFLTLSMREILNAVAVVCPRILSSGKVVNIDLDVNFLEYYEILINVCELNARKVQRYAAMEATRRFQKDIIKPALTKRLLRKKQAAASQKPRNKTKRKKINGK